MPGYSCRPHSPSETCWLKLFALPISLAWSYLAQVSRACCYCVLLCLGPSVLHRPCSSLPLPPPSCWAAFLGPHNCFPKAQVDLPAPHPDLSRLFNRIRPLAP